MKLSLKMQRDEKLSAYLEGGHRIDMALEEKEGLADPQRLFLAGLAGDVFFSLQRALQSQGVAYDLFEIHLTSERLDCEPEAIGRLFFHCVVEAEGLSEQGLSYLLEHTVRACPLVSSVRADIGYAFRLNGLEYYPLSGEYKAAVIPEPKSCADDLFLGILSLTDKT